MLNRERCSPTIILERSIKKFFVLIVFFIVTFLESYEDGDESFFAEGGWVIALVALGIFAILLFSYWISWYNTYISAVDDNLIYESGIFVKKKISIPVSKINTIDRGRNIIQRILGTESLKIDTGTVAENSENKAEMDLVFSVKRGEEIRSYILSQAANEESVLRSAGQSPIIAHGEPKWAIKASFSDFFLYGLTSSSVLKAISYIFIVFLFFAELSDALINKLLEVAEPLVESVVGFVTGSPLLMLILIGIMLLVIMFVVSNIINILWATIRFYNFRVARDGDNVVIRYGLISLKNYTLPVKNIHAVNVKQNLLQQLLKKASIEIVTIGYGNEEQETALLFPIVSLQNVPALIDEIIPEYSGNIELTYSGRKGVRYNVVYPVIIWGVVMAAAVAVLLAIFKSVVSAIAFPLTVYLLIAAAVILNHKHTAVGIDNKAIEVQSGGFTKTRTHIRLDAVQSITSTAGIFKRRRNMANIIVSYHAPQLQSTVIAKSFDKAIIDDLMTKIVD